MTDMVSHVKIRPMIMDDIGAVAAMEAEIFTDAWSEKLYRETLESGRYDCQVLEITEQDADGLDKGAVLAGYFCGQVILDEAEVHRIAVDPAMRGRGYGQVLLEGTGEWCSDGAVGGSCRKCTCHRPLRKEWICRHRGSQGLLPESKRGCADPAEDFLIEFSTAVEHTFRVYCDGRFVCTDSDNEEDI